MKKYGFIVPLVLLLVLFISTSMVTAADSELFYQSIAGYFNGNYQESINGFETFLNSNVDGQEMKIRANYYLALDYLGLYDVTKAKSIMDNLEKKGYLFGYLNWRLGQVYLNKEGHFDSPFYNQARIQLEKAVELGINSPELHSDLAMAYQGTGNVEAAIEEYEKVLARGGDVGDYINLASLYKETGENRKAIEYFNQALQTDTDNISIYLNLGELYLAEKDYTNAVEIMEKGSEINSKFVALRYKLATAYYQSGATEKALNEFEKVVELNQNTYQAYYYLGKIYLEKDNEIRAEYNFKQAIQYNPDYAQAYIDLGNIYLNQKNYYKAISQFTTAIEKNNNFPPGHYYLALAYKELGMKEAAVAELRKTLHLSSGNKEAQALLDELQED